MNKPDFSVVIVTWNRLLLLKDAVASVFKQKDISFEIVIIDNGNNTDTYLWASSLNNQKIKYIKTHKNLGIITARNIGIANSEGNFIFLFDDDAIIDNERLFYKIKEHFTKDNNLDVIAINIIENNTSREKITYNYFSGDFFGGAVFFKKEIFDKVGYFDDSFFRQAEEFDYIFRLLSKKALVYFVTDLYIIHKKFEAKRQSNADILYYSFRNKAIAIKKNIPLFDRLFFSFRNNLIHFFLFLKIMRLDLFFKAIKSKNRILNENKKLINPVTKETMKNWYYLMKYKPKTFNFDKDKITILKYILSKINRI